MNWTKTFVARLITTATLVFFSREVCTQAQEWQLVPPVHNSAAQLTQETGLDFENFQLLTEVLNAVDYLAAKGDENTPLFTAEELAKIHAIKLEVHEPLLLEAEASEKGVEVDSDVLFAMRTSKASDALALVSQVLGGKMQTVIQVVNRRRLGDWSDEIPIFVVERIAQLLSLDSSQQKSLKLLADRYESAKEGASKKLADELRVLRDKYRRQMIACLDAGQRRWYESTFGEPVDLLDENGRSVFCDLVAPIDFGPASEFIETIRSLGVPSIAEVSTGDGLIKPTEQDGQPEKLVVDTIDFSLIRSNLVHEELDINNSQKKKIQQALVHRTVKLTRDLQKSRLTKLAKGEPIERPELFDVLLPSQLKRLNQIEIQVRTGPHLTSFGIRDGLVARHLGLDANARKQIGQLAEEYQRALSELLEKHRSESHALVKDYQLQAFDLLTEPQKEKFEGYFGVADR